MKPFPEQTYITHFIDEKGQTIDFERWFCKRLQTCINNTIKLYGTNYNPKYYRYSDTLKSTKKVIIYKTEPLGTGWDRETNMWEVSIDEFIERIKSYRDSLVSKIQKLRQQ